MNRPEGMPELVGWVDEIAALTTPDRVHWCDGSDAEYRLLCDGLVDAGTFTRIHRSGPPERLTGPGRARAEERPTRGGQRAADWQKRRAMTAG